ncbi:2343_t:CDS:2, partial [Racocetra persica]
RFSESISEEEPPDFSNSVTTTCPHPTFNSKTIWVRLGRDVA